jgi:hypothetical protein
VLCISRMVALARGQLRAARIIATMPTLIASGSVEYVFSTSSRMGSVEARLPCADHR